jgi:hypothetical protein
MADIANSTTAPAAQAPSAFKAALNTYMAAVEGLQNADEMPAEEVYRLGRLSVARRTEMVEAAAPDLASVRLKIETFLKSEVGGFNKPLGAIYPWIARSDHEHWAMLQIHEDLERLDRVAGDTLLFQLGLRFGDLVVAEAKAEAVRDAIKRNVWPDGLRERGAGETEAEWLHHISEAENASGYGLACDLADGIAASLGAVYDDAKTARATMPETFAIKAGIAAHDCLFQGTKDADWPEWRDSLIADLQGMAHPSEIEAVEALAARHSAAYQLVGDLTWVTDEVAHIERGKPTDEQWAAFREAEDTLQDLDEAFLKLQPTTLRALSIKAGVLNNSDTFEADHALDVLTADIARLAGGVMAPQVDGRS